MRRGARARPARRAVAALAVAVVAATTAGACGGEDDDALVVWTLENLPDRLAAQQEILDAWSARSGVDVRLVGVAEDQFNQLLLTSAAAGDLPDVVGALPLAGVRALAAADLVDTEVAGDLVDDLGAETFTPRSLELTRDGAAQLAVPSDGWVQLLVYRRDLFEAAGLARPDTYEAMVVAARALDSPGLAGFTGASVAGDSFTQQSFEHVALGNGCRLVDGDGVVTLDDPRCVEAFTTYGELVRDLSVPGAQDVDTTRATYFAGEAAMLLWSSFVLDEMAGLRDDALPSCPECRDDPAFLADASGVVTAVRGPDGEEAAQFGEVVSWAVTRTARPEAADLVAHMMGEGYEPWLGFAPEGKVPVRLGTPEDPTRYLDAWATLPAGVDTRVPLSEVYPPEVLDALVAGTAAARPWGIEEGQGALVGATLGEQPVAAAVAAVASGELTPAEAAAQAAEDVRDIQRSLR